MAGKLAGGMMGSFRVVAFWTQMEELEFIFLCRGCVLREVREVGDIVAAAELCGVASFYSMWSLRVVAFRN